MESTKNLVVVYIISECSQETGLCSGKGESTTATAATNINAAATSQEILNRKTTQDSPYQMSVKQSNQKQRRQFDLRETIDKSISSST